MPTSYDPFRPHSAAHVTGLDTGARQPAVEPVREGTVPEVLAWVGDDKERAQRALDAEQQHDRPRKGLVAELNERLDA